MHASPYITKNPARLNIADRCIFWHYAAVQAIASVALVACLSSIARCDVFGSGTNSFTIDFVSVGDAGNAGDLGGGAPPGAGAVAYEYRMGKYEISTGMVQKANALGNLQITMNSSGVNRPANSVNWNEAARFINWLNTSSGYSPAYKFLYQPSQPNYQASQDILLWEPTDTGYDANNLYRNSNAAYFLPSLDEWYKAAYYKGGGLDVGYWAYATQSNSPPTAVVSGTAPGTAVYLSSFGAANINLAGGPSWYGTVGQGGNVMEWNETAIGGANDDPILSRVIRGGASGSGASPMASSSYSANSPRTEDLFEYGFRVASVAVVPEPSTAGLLVAGIACASTAALRLRRGQAKPR
jgi:sulfatase modifying factor 1